MPFLVQDLLEGKTPPVTVRPEDPVKAALGLMIKYDYSQLPIVDLQGHPLGMVTYESILRGIRHFKTTLEQLNVRDVRVNAAAFHPEDDLFDMLAQLKLTNAVLVIDAQNSLVGIVTSYDSTEYFRNRAEHMMRVEDIETTIKEIIPLAFIREDGSIDLEKMDEAVAAVSRQDGLSDKPKTFSELSLGQYISMLISNQRWPVFEPIFQLSRDVVRNLFDDIRRIRNDLAHFRTELTIEQIDQLRFCADWLSKHWEVYQKANRELVIQKLFEQQPQLKVSEGGQVDYLAHTEPDQRKYIIETQTFDDWTSAAQASVPLNSVIYTTAVAGQTTPGESRYAALADWLQSIPGDIDQVPLTFAEIEEIIGGKLPASAHSHRAWWANDAQGHPHSKEWLEAGWRRAYLSLDEKRVTFVRIIEREKSYIEFFNKLLAQIKAKADFPIRDISPDGTSWISLRTLLPEGPAVAYYNFSFARGRRMRVELYIDTGFQQTTKQIFDRLYAQKEALEARLGEISWERLDDRQASRIALYHSGWITFDEQRLSALRLWAVDTMIAFQKAIEPAVSQAIREVLKP